MLLMLTYEHSAHDVRHISSKSYLQKQGADDATKHISSI